MRIKYKRIFMCNTVTRLNFSDSRTSVTSPVFVGKTDKIRYTLKFNGR